MSDSARPTDTGRFVANEVRQMLDQLAKDVSEDVKGINQHVTDTTNTVLRSHQAMRHQLVHVTKMTATMWRRVMGSEPPPAPPPRSEDVSFTEAHQEGVAEAEKERQPSLVDEVEKIGEQQGEIDELRGQLLAVKSQTAELLSLQKEQMGKKDPNDQRRTLAKLVDGFLWVLKEREGQKTAGAIVAGITGIITAAGTWYALVTGRLPMPNTTAPTAITVPAHEGRR